MTRWRRGQSTWGRRVPGQYSTTRGRGIVYAGSTNRPVTGRFGRQGRASRSRSSRRIEKCGTALTPAPPPAHPPGSAGRRLGGASWYRCWKAIPGRPASPCWSTKKITIRASTMTASCAPATPGEAVENAARAHVLAASHPCPVEVVRPQPAFSARDNIATLHIPFLGL